MASINLYKLDPDKFQACLQELSSSKLQQKKTIFLTKSINDCDREFGATLYLEEPHQGNESISWNNFRQSRRLNCPRYAYVKKSHRSMEKRSTPSWLYTYYLHQLS